MRFLIIPLMLMGTVAYSQTIVVQKCASSAFEEPTFVTVTVDTVTNLRPAVNSAQEEGKSAPVPVNTSSPQVQAAKAKKDD